MSELCNRMRAGDVGGAREIHFRLLPWMRAAFIESNPLPVKAGLAMMGKIENVLRLPLVPMADTHADAVRAALKTAGGLQGMPKVAIDVLRRGIESHAAPPAEKKVPRTARPLVDTLLTLLEAGEVRAAESHNGRWEAVPWVKQGILLGFRIGRAVDFGFR